MSKTFLVSRSGALFGAEVSEADGVLSITSNDGQGWKSAHRTYAQLHGYSHRTAKVGMVNLSGVRIVITEWSEE